VPGKPPAARREQLVGEQADDRHVRLSFLWRGQHEPAAHLEFGEPVVADVPSEVAGPRRAENAEDLQIDEAFVGAVRFMSRRPAGVDAETRTRSTQ